MRSKGGDDTNARNICSQEVAWVSNDPGKRSWRQSTIKGHLRKPRNKGHQNPKQLSISRWAARYDARKAEDEVKNVGPEVRTASFQKHIHAQTTEGILFRANKFDLFMDKTGVVVRT